MAKKKRMDKDDEERLQEFINKQVEMGTKEIPEPEYTELKRESEEEKIKVDIALAEKKLKMSEKFIMPYNVLTIKKEKKMKMDKDAIPGTSKKCALDEILIEEETKKERKNRKDYWLCEEIVVKVLTVKLKISILILIFFR